MAAITASTFGVLVSADGTLPRQRSLQRVALEQGGELTLAGSDDREVVLAGDLVEACEAHRLDRDRRAARGELVHPAVALQADVDRGPP